MTTHAQLPDAGSLTHHQIDDTLQRHESELGRALTQLQALQATLDNLPPSSQIIQHAQLPDAGSLPHHQIDSVLQRHEGELGQVLTQLQSLKAAVANFPPPGSQEPQRHADLPDAGRLSHHQIDDLLTQINARLATLATTIETNRQPNNPPTQQLDHSSLPGAGRTTHTEIDLQLPSTTEKQALAGTPGTPDEDNPYLTADHVDNAETVTGQWDFSNQLTTFGPNAAWRVGEEVLDLDFTGTSYDTVAECNVVGLRFSDSDTPFPTTLRHPVSGSWSHSAGNGWQASPSTDEEGPAILIPLCRPGNWELELVINHASIAVADKGRLFVGYIAASNHVGACAAINDANNTVIQLLATLNTNDGDDTFTAQYTGSALTGSGERTYKFRSKNGCVSVWDEQDDAWHNYQGRQNAGLAYTPAWAFIQHSKYTSYTFYTVYLQSLKLTYLL